MSGRKNESSVALEEACKFIEDHTGECPLSLCNEDPWEGDCEKKCQSMGQGENYKCWIVYFKTKKDL